MVTEGDIQNIKKLFFSYDLDGDRKLNNKELKKLFQAMGEILSMNEMNETLYMLDTNNDNKVSMDEFINFFMNDIK